MLDTAESKYDEVLYGGHARPQTHPDRLATLATLFGMTPARPERCRVLELGCGDGANLIPMALGLPGSTFVGLDLAARPIALGCEVARALRLANVSLKACDVLHISVDLGQFDYIIAHGFLSWVPPTVQEKTFSICKENLAPSGVAYISYNAYPGAHQRHMVRDMLRILMPPVAEPRQKIRQARTLMRSMRSAIARGEVHARFMDEELERTEGRSDAALFHDDLAEHNRAFYFHQFMERARGHGLQYLAEADYADMQEDICPPPILEKLRTWAGDDVVKMEQYLDFVKNRGFRQTLLCHAEVELSRRIPPERLRGLRVASPAWPAEPASLKGPGEVEFRGPKDTALVCDMPLVKAALFELGEQWPGSVAFDTLARRARQLVDLAETDSWDAQAEALAGMLLQAYGAGFIEMRLGEPVLSRVAGDRPVASALARLQVQRGGAVVTSLTHKNVRLADALSRQLLLLLDGTRDRADLLASLTATVVAGEVESSGQWTAGGGQLSEGALSATLERLAEMALLSR